MRPGPIIAVLVAVAIIGSAWNPDPPPKPGETEIIVEVCGYDFTTGLTWYSDGELFYAFVDGKWLVGSTIYDLAATNPLGRGRRVRVHGVGATP